MDKERHKNFVDNSIKNNYDMDQIYHIMEQIKYCNKWFKKSYKTYGNATPIELQKKIKDFKAIENRNEKISALNKLTDSE
jgi:hypothetical protein